MPLTPEDNQFNSAIRATERVKNLTVELLEQTTKEQLIELISIMNSSKYWDEITSQKTASEKGKTVGEFISEFKILMDNLSDDV
ncbi:hypothetical protein [Planktothrix sp.]|uniref:hypothetical protein n=1 Tax=Planktothrix sp. TaxID=3088171 RepID=UPI0038D486A7